jgi:hypothetical protein
MRLHYLPECILDRIGIVNVTGRKGKDQIGPFHLKRWRVGRAIDSAEKGSSRMGTKGIVLDNKKAAAKDAATWFRMVG